MASSIDITNSALVSLGESPISSFTDNSTAATVANVKWDIVRRALIATHPWNFAIKRAQLARATASPTYKYQYKYPLPADCLRVLEIYLDGDYKREQRSIFTSEPECYIKYVADVTDTELWDPLFVDAVAAKLAVELAYTIPRAAGMIATMEQLFQQKLATARYVDASEDIPDQLGQFDSELITTRF